MFKGLGSKVFKAISTPQKKLEPDNFLLSFMYSGDAKPIEGKLILVKTVFLAIKQKFQDLDQFYKFRAYDYGPYSDVLASQLNNFIDKGIISVEKCGERYDYSLSPLGKTIAQKAYSNQSPEIQHDLEEIRRSNQKIGYRGILRKVYSNYPEYTTKSKIRDEVNGYQ